MTHHDRHHSKCLIQRLEKFDKSLDVLENLIDLLPQMSAPQDALKQRLLTKYAARDPQTFFQFDAFTNVVDDDTMCPD